MTPSLEIDSGSSHSAGSQERMFSLTYVSSATQLFSSDDLRQLLARCRENNAALNITGMLLYKDGNFMQVLEGEEAQVRTLFDKISTDPRHQGELVLHQGFVEQRRFPEWSMGFRDLDTPEVRAIPGYSDFLNTPLTGQEFSTKPASSQKLLLTFKKSM